MTRLHKLLLAALGVQLALAALLWTRGGAPAIGRLEAIAPFDVAAATRVQISGEPALELTKQGDGWVLASQFGHPADPAKVSALLDRLAGLRSRGPIASGEARAAQLEVDDASPQRKVVVTAGGKDLTFLIGAAAGPNRAAVRLAGQDAIHAVAGLSAAGISTAPAGYVAPAYLEVDEARVAAVVVQNARGRFELTRAEGGWQVSHDGKAPAVPPGQELDVGKLAGLVRAAAKLELVAPGDPARAIEKPEATITLRLAAEAGPGADAGAIAQSSPPEERVVELVSDKDDRYFVRERGNPRAALIEGWRLRDLVELDVGKLHRAPEPSPPPGAGDAPAGMEGLPPELLDQLRAQGAVP